MPRHTTTEEGFYTYRRLSWTAIIIGAFVAVGLSFLLNLFGLAIGLSAFSVDNNAGSATLAIGGFIGLVIGSIVAMFVAGWVAGYLSRGFAFNRNMGVLYGFAAWCLALIIAVLIASSANELVSARDVALYNPTTSLIRTTTGSQPVASPGTSADNSARKMQPTVSTPGAASLSLFLTFLLFFIGALSSCFGGYLGYLPGKDYD